MAIVDGKDIARGNYSKSFGDIDIGASMESVPSKAESGTSLDSRPHCKRSRNDEDACDLEKISDQLQEVVSALKQFSNDQLNVEKLHEEIMKVEEVDRAGNSPCSIRSSGGT